MQGAADVFHLFSWLRRPRRLPQIKADGKLRCSQCGGPLHRHERFEILAVRHRDCQDPRQTGQRSLALGLGGGEPAGAEGLGARE